MLTSSTPSKAELEAIVQETELSFHQSRAQFLKTAGSVALFAALGISFTACDSNKSLTGDTTPPPDNGGGGNQSGFSFSSGVLTIDLTRPDAQNLATAGNWALVLVARTLIVNIDGTTIRAFSSICPHASCDRNWQYTNQQFRCTCHDSRFTNAGVRVSGPANRNLTEFNVQRDGNTVIVTTA